MSPLELAALEDRARRGRLLENSLEAIGVSIHSLSTFDSCNPIEKVVRR